MEISDDAKAIVAANIISAAATIQFTKSQDGHLKDFMSCIEIALKHYQDTLDAI